MAATPPETPLARRRAARATELYVSPSEPFLHHPARHEAGGPPRFALPGLAAWVLSMVFTFAAPATRLEALRIVLLQGGAFVLVTAALLWPTGDTVALIARLRPGQRTPPGDSLEEARP